MATNNRPKFKSQAPDILDRPLNWVQKVSSLRLSNIRVGQHFTDVGQHLTNMLADKDAVSDQSYKNSPSNDTSFYPSFCKLLKTKYGGSLIFVGGMSGAHIWVTSFALQKNSDYTTDFLYNWEERGCTDLCFSDQCDDFSLSSPGCVIVYLLLAGNRKKGSSSASHSIRAVAITGDFSSVRSMQVSAPPALSANRHFEGSADAINCTDRFLLVSQTSTGSVQFLCRTTLQRLGVVPSLGPQQPVVLAASARWIAIQSEH